MKAFVELQFVYCPLLCMFPGKKANSKINYIYESVLNPVYRNSVQSIKGLLKLDKSSIIDHIIILPPAMELYKVKK